MICRLNVMLRFDMVKKLLLTKHDHVELFDDKVIRNSI